MPATRFRRDQMSEFSDMRKSLVALPETQCFTLVVFIKVLIPTKIASGYGILQRLIGENPMLVPASSTILSLMGELW
jgi:hypothetical protein